MKRIGKESFKTRMRTSNYNMMLSTSRNKSLNLRANFVPRFKNGEVMPKLRNESSEAARMSSSKRNIN